MKIFDKVIALVNADDLKRRRFALWFNRLLYRLQHKLVKYPTKLWYRPPSLQIEVTRRCILRCPCCSRQNLIGAPEHNVDMSMQTFRKIVPVFRYVHWLRLIGLGEPLLNPNFMEMLEIAKREGVAVVFHTNGILLNDDLCQRLIQLKVDLVVFSIDGATADTYEEIKVGAKFDKVIANLKRFVEIKQKVDAGYPRLSIAYTIGKNNLEEVPAMVDLAHNLGIGRLWFQTYIAFSELVAQLSTYQLDPGYVSRIFAEAKRKADSSNIEIRLPQIKIEDFKPIICTEPWWDMYIRWNGIVTPCPYCADPFCLYYSIKEGRLVNEKIMEDPVGPMVIGDVNKEGIFKIWNNQKYRKFRAEIKTGQSKPPHNRCIFPYGIH